eukprot:scaffold32450_cov18-Tisochrysis_lutea.AAC.1
MLREVKSCGKMCSYYSLRVCKVQRTEAMQPVDQPLGGGAQGGWPIANCCSAFPGFQMCAGLVAACLGDALAQGYVPSHAPGSMRLLSFLRKIS